MEHFKDNSGCSGPKKSEIFWNNSRKVQYVFAGAVQNYVYRSLQIIWGGHSETDPFYMFTHFPSSM